MKKCNILTGTTVVVPVFVFLLIALAGCKTVPENPSVDPFSLLDTDSSIYFKIPVAPHKDFVKSILLSKLPQLSDTDVQMITSRLNAIYAGIGTTDDAARIQISATGEIPPFVVKSVFSEKNGWIGKSAFFTNSVTSVPYRYFMREGSDFQLAFPSVSNILLADNVQPLLGHYDTLMSGTSVLREEIQSVWVADTYEWMNSDSSDMRFCVLRPQAFLAHLLGVDMRLALVCAKGSLAETSDNDRLILSLQLEFQNGSAARAARAMLSLALGSNAVAMSYNEETHTLILSNIEISKVQVLDLLLQ